MTASDLGRPADPKRSSPSENDTQLQRPARFSVACNFDPGLVDALADLPAYEVYGKLPADFFGGGRPSFYLPKVDRQGLERYVQRCHAQGLEFNYLLNSSSMDNLEFTSEGQREFRKLLDWLSECRVDSLTVSNLFFLRAIKRQYPHFKVRVSAHRETDNPRKARFWEDNGADCIVISETTTHREFDVLEAIRDSVSVDLSLIVNNWCRQDCAIANSHAVLLSNASRSGKQRFPLDYCSVYCNAYRVEEPVNYVRANWIRPEDLPRYRKMGYSNFKIVERNTPTALLEMRVRAYAREYYDGNLLDLVQNYAYPRSLMGGSNKQFYSASRMVRHFLKPGEVNVLRFPQIQEYGKRLSLLYPREGDNPVYVDNRALDGFLDGFEKRSCAQLDCETCGYCQRWAQAAVKMDPEWRADMQESGGRLLDSLHDGSLWESYGETMKRWVSRAMTGKQLSPVAVAMPGKDVRKSKGVRLRVIQTNPGPLPDHPVSVGNDGPTPQAALARTRGQA